MTASGTFAKFSRLSCCAHVLLSRQLEFSICSTATKIQIPINLRKQNIATTTQHFQICKKVLIKETKNMSKYTTVAKGAANSTNYSVYFQNENGHAISPLHDIPLYANKEKTIYNMVVEIPRWTNAKMEISLKKPLNPIKQDVKKEKLRFVSNCFPHKGYIWNYGAFPQTWENPDHIEISTGCKGDNDPIDVLEIGYRVAKLGEVIQVKILGTVALIDEGETDWKIIAIDIRDPLADKLNDVCDIYKYCPGLLRATVEWFKIYKIPDGKPENAFAFNGDPKDAQFATKVVSETHNFWKGLVDQSLDRGSIECSNTTVKDSPYLIDQESADKIISEAPEGGEVQEVADTVDRWHFIHLG